MLAQEKAVNAKRHEDLLSALTTTLPRSPPSPRSLQVSNPCSLNILISLFSPCLHQLFALSFVRLINIGYISFWFFSLHYCARSRYHLFVRDSDGQYH